MTLLSGNGADLRWPGLRERLAGTTFDSAPAALTISALSRAAVSSMPAEGMAGRALRPLAAALAPAIGAVLTLGSRPADFWRHMQDDTLPCHSLYIYSEADTVTDVAALDSLVAHRRARHARGPAAVSALRLRTSPHVGHLRAEPESYVAALASLVRAGAPVAARTK